MVRRHFYTIALLMAAVLGAAALVSAQPQPATAPATVPASASGVSVPNPAIDRLQGALAGLDLSSDQRGKIEALITEVRRQLQPSPDMSPEDRRDTFRQVMADARRQMGQILTTDQQGALRDRMQKQLAVSEPAPAPKVAPTAPRPVSEPMRVEPKKPEIPPAMAETRKQPGNANPPANPVKPASPAPPSDDGSASTGAIGTKAADFKLQRVGVGTLALSSLSNRVVVLEFASYSAPSFRYRSTAMDALDKEYGGRVQFLVVYTAEAYPAGEWEIDRNKTDKVTIPRHPDADARLVAAENAKAILKPRRDIVVDTMDNTTAKAYRAGAHTAVVIGRDGTIVARQQWCDPDGLKRYLDEATVVKVEKKE